MFKKRKKTFTHRKIRERKFLKQKRREVRKRKVKDKIILKHKIFIVANIMGYLNLLIADLSLK